MLASFLYFHNNGNMKISNAVAALSALAQETRLSIFRLLVERGPDGLNAGAIALQLKLPPATLSFHIAQLVRAGLVTARPESRFIFYSANFTAMDELLAYMTDNCCQGDACLPRTASAARCRTPVETE